MKSKEKVFFLPEPNVARMVESILGCKWSVSVLDLLKRGINRPGEMQRALPGLTTKVLNERLSKLCRFNLLKKTVFPESPPHVEYTFTAFGERFLDLLDTVERLQKELDQDFTQPFTDQ